MGRVAEEGAGFAGFATDLDMTPADPDILAIPDRDRLIQLAWKPDAEAICAFSNPTVNSYKRLNAVTTTSWATWSPTTISYGGNNRTHPIRIPARERFEFRLYRMGLQILI